MNICILGLPGSGKTLLSRLLSEKLNLFFVDMGDILRHSKDPEVKEYIEKGELVPPNIMMRELDNYLNGREDNIIFCGVPRNKYQENHFKYKLDKVIFLKLPEKIIIDRFLNRRICENCGKTYMLKEIDELIEGIHYHFPAIKPKKEGICDICGGKLIKRKDDNEEVIKNRIKKFYEETYPIIEDYKKKGILIEFIPNGDPETLANKLVELIKNGRKD